MPPRRAGGTRGNTYNYGSIPRPRSTRRALSAEQREEIQQMMNEHERQRADSGPVQQVAYGPGSGSGSGGSGGGSPSAQASRSELAQIIEEGRKSGMTSRELLQLAGRAEAESKSSSKSEKEKKGWAKSYEEGAKSVALGTGNLGNMLTVMSGNILLVIVMVLMMWIVIQFFGMV